MEKGDDAFPSERLIAANDNGTAADPVQVDAALTRIAEAIGHQIARRHIRAPKAANDNEPGEDQASADS